MDGGGCQQNDSLGLGGKDSTEFSKIVAVPPPRKGKIRGQRDTTSQQVLIGTLNAKTENRDGKFTRFMLKCMTRRKKPARYNVNESLKRCFSYPGNMSAQGMKVSASFWSRRTKKWTKIYEVSVVAASELLLHLTDYLTDWCCCICRRTLLETIGGKVVATGPNAGEFRD